LIGPQLSGSFSNPEPSHGRPPLPLLPATVSAFPLSSLPDHLWAPRLSAAPLAGLSPPQDGNRSRLPPSLPGQPREMAQTKSRLSSPVPAVTPYIRRAESARPAPARSKAPPAKSCKEQLGFRPKAFGCRVLATGTAGGESGKEQLGYHPSADSSNTCAKSGSRGGFLKRTSLWSDPLRCCTTDPC
jgi:hypothetical protein